MLALCLAGAATAGDGMPPDMQPSLVIGAIYPLSGPQARGGSEELAGVRAALDLARRDLSPRHVQLRVVDATTPEQARAAVDRLIDQDHVPTVVGTYGSTLSEAAASRAEERRTVRGGRRGPRSGWTPAAAPGIRRLPPAGWRHRDDDTRRGRLRGRLDAVPR